jgi:hypothetical protein
LLSVRSTASRSPFRALGESGRAAE